MNDDRKEHKFRVQNGVTPNYKASHEVYITKDIGADSKEKIVDFINKHIADFKGIAEEKAGIPIMLFERKQDAQAFADQLSEKLDIQKEHITIKARKFTR